MSRYASGKIVKLTAKLNPADTTLYADIDVGVTTGRLYFNSDLQEEWIDFTGVAASGSAFAYSGLTRGLSQTADPATAGTGKTWIAGSSGTLVAMHDQLVDKQNDNTFEGSNTYEGVETFEEAIITEKGVASTVYANTAARDAALGGDGVATKAYTAIQAGSIFYNYNTATAQWESIDTGTVTPDASETVAGKVEIPTQTESDTGADTGATGAFASITPQRAGRSIQKQAWTYGVDSGAADAYVLTLTPAAAAYIEAMIISVKISTVNTGASTINVNSLGVKSLKNGDGVAFASGELALNGTYNFQYDGTDFILYNPKKATTAQVDAGLNKINYTTPLDLSMFPGTAVTYFTQSVSENNVYTYDFTRSGTYLFSFSGRSNSASFDYVGFNNAGIDGALIIINSTSGTAVFGGSLTLPISSEPDFIFSTHITANKGQTFSITFPDDASGGVQGTVTIKGAY